MAIQIDGAVQNKHDIFGSLGIFDLGVAATCNNIIP